MGNNVAPIIEEFRRAYTVLKKEVFDKHNPTHWGYNDQGQYTLIQGPATMPMPVITVQARGRKHVDGWYKPVAWDSQAADAMNVLAGTGKTVASTDEICIAAEALGKTGDELLTILLHQMVHHYVHHNECSGRGHTTTQNDNGYHTTTFESRARRFGLEAELDGSGGYRKVKLSQFGYTVEQDVRKAFINIALDMSKFDMFRKSTDSKSDNYKPGSKLKKWSCGCTNLRVATMLHASCNNCGNRFLYADKDYQDAKIQSWLSSHGEGSI